MKNQFLPNSMGLLSPLKKWFEDPSVSEIIINRPKEVIIESNGSMKSYVIAEYDMKTLMRLFQLIVNEQKGILDEAHPIFSGNIYDGSRVQLVISPVSRYPIMSIRRVILSPRCLNEYPAYYFAQKLSQDAKKHHQQLHALFKHKNWAAFIQAAILAKKNIVISGGTSSGKTTFLNTCLQEIPVNERLVLLEDTREISISHPNQVSLITNESANIDLQQLLKCSLRLRPDRMIIGELRGKEIMGFVDACISGHPGGMTTIHANNTELAFLRMMQLFKLNNVPSMSDDDILSTLKSVVDVIIQLEKTPNGRCITDIYYRDVS